MFWGRVTLQCSRGADIKLTMLTQACIILYFVSKRQAGLVIIIMFHQITKKMFQSHQREGDLWEKKMINVKSGWGHWSVDTKSLIGVTWARHWNPVCSGSGLSFQRSQVQLKRMAFMGLEKERREQSWSCQWYFYKPASRGHFHQGILIDDKPNLMSHSDKKIPESALLIN